MALVTQFFPCASPAPYTPATLRGSWNVSPSGSNGALTLSDDKTGARVGPISRSSGSAANPYRIAIARFISNPLATQTISGSLNMAISIQEANADANYFTKVFLYVTQGDSDTPRGTLLDLEDTGATEWVTTSFGQVYAFSSTQALSSLAVTAGDRLVLEFGVISVAGTATSRSATMWAGATNRFLTGAILDDAVVGATGTGVTRAGFFEFTTAIDVPRASAAEGDLLVGNRELFLFDGTSGALKRRILPIGSQDPAGGAQLKNGGTLYVSYESLNVGDDPLNGQVAIYDPVTLAYQGLFQTMPGVGPHAIAANLADQLYVGHVGDGEGATSCGENWPTETGNFPRNSPPSTVLIAASSQTREVSFVVTVTTTFANGDGAQPTFEIGETGDLNKFFPTSTFTNQTATTEFTVDGTITAGAQVLVTAVAATGTTSTGALSVVATYLGEGASASYAIRKFNAAGTLQAALLVAPDAEGSNSIDLASDQATMLYTSVGRLVKSYNVATDTQNADFATLPAASAGEKARGLRILPDGTVLVADVVDIKRLNTSGAVIQTYSVVGQDDWGTLALSPDGTEFWAANRADGAVATPYIAKFNVATGTEVLSITALEDTSGGMCSGGITVIGGFRAGIFEPPGTGTIVVVKQTTPQPDTTAFAFNATNLTPSSFNLSDGETQTYLGLTPGDGYGVAETPNVLYLTEVTVSNGSPIDNLDVEAGETVIVTFTNRHVGQVTIPQGTTHLIRRLRRSPHVSNLGDLVFVKLFQVDFEAGVGLTSGQGINPLVEVRVSRDAGHTWGPIHVVEAGRLGEYRRRMLLRQLGRGRDLVFEVSVSDPVAWRIITAYLDLEAGIS